MQMTVKCAYTTWEIPLKRSKSDAIFFQSILSDGGLRYWPMRTFHNSIQVSDTIFEIVLRPRLNEKDCENRDSPVAR